MIVPLVLVLIVVVYLWRRLRKARQRRAAAVTAAPVVQAMAGHMVVRKVPSRFTGSRGQM